MLIGAWGAHASELLERLAEQDSTQVHRIADLTMMRQPDVIEGSWCCWLFGAPEARDELAERLERTPGESLAASLARSLEVKGAAACELLCGRFVLVALERERGRCMVVRDQLGAQSLVHANVGQGTLFAEHERDLLEALGRTPSPDRLALAQWIGNGLTPTGRTLFEDVSRLPAGHVLELHGTSSAVRRWWQLRYRDTEQGDPDSLALLLREQAFAAISRASAGSERLAVKLSGGLDSACVAAGLQARGFAGRALALGSTFPDFPEADERELIRQSAEHAHLSLELIGFDLARSMLDPAIEHIARWRLPPATPNTFLWEPLMARARERGVEVMLDGEGGDELFGLSPQLIADMLRTGRLGKAWALTARMPHLATDANVGARLGELRRCGLSPLLPSGVRRRRERSRRERSDASSSIVRLADTQRLADLHEQSTRQPREGPLWWQSLAESVIDTRDLLDLGGHYRRAAADEQVDRRHPFLHDLQLIEAVLRIPPQRQFDPLRDRPLLRDGLRGLIPEAVRTRHAKSHFTRLVLAGINGEETGLLAPLRRADAPVRAFVSEPALDRRIAVPRAQRPMLGAGSLWRVAIANRWLLAEMERGT
jgi:asparagine synthase (glutamine-hydrolysing)